MRNSETLVMVLDPGVYGVTKGGIQAFETLVCYAHDGMEFEVFLNTEDEIEILGDDYFGDEG